MISSASRKANDKPKYEAPIVGRIGSAEDAAKVSAVGAMMASIQRARGTAALRTVQAA